MADLPFLDANIILRHVLQDLPDQSPRATALIRRVEAGDQQVRTTDTVIFEAAFVLEEAAFVLERTYKVPRREIRDNLLPLIELPGVILRGKRRYRRLFALYLAHPKLSFADCAHVAVMESLRLTDLVSIDRGFDQVRTITRKEPDSAGELPT